MVPEPLSDLGKKKTRLLLKKRVESLMPSGVPELEAVALLATVASAGAFAASATVSTAASAAVASTATAVAAATAAAISTATTTAAARAFGARGCLAHAELASEELAAIE